MPEETEVRVVAAVVCRDGRYLICQRPFSKRHGGLWEFPGGKAVESESDIDTIRRELREELGVDIAEIDSPQLTLRDPNSPFLIVFVPVRIVGQPTAHEHLEIRWATIPELLGLALAPTDRVFAQHLAARQ